MRITIQGTLVAPKWETLQNVIRESMDDDTALLIRIARVDGGANYRSPGLYDLDVLLDDGSMLGIVYEVTF